MKKKLLALFTVAAMLVTGVQMPVHAAEDTTATVKAEIASQYSITIPKALQLSVNKETHKGTGSYQVSLTGDTDVLTTINVVPDSSFDLVKESDSTKVVASVTQNKTSWVWTDLSTDTASVANGSVEVDDLYSGSYEGTFYFNVDTTIRSIIDVTATDEDGGDLQAYSYTIEGDTKDALLEKLIASGVTDTVTSADDVDALIEVESDSFDTIATTTFNVSDIAQDGDTVVILHYNEETSEWEYIGTYEVEDGKVTADFTSYSPVAFVVVKEDGTLHSHSYSSSVTTVATCKTEGVKTYTCDCGDSYTESIPVVAHSYRTSETYGSCTTKGSVTYTCRNCNYSYTEETDYCHMYASDVCTKCFIVNISSDNIDDFVGSQISFSGDVTLPQTFEYEGGDDDSLYPAGTYTIVSILDNYSSTYTPLFGNRDEPLTSITASFDFEIYGHPFVSCANLTSININNSNYCSVDGVLFTKDMKTLIAYPAGKSETSYTIPDGVETIEDYAFYECSNLTNIVIPDSVTTIGDWAFSGCKFDSLTLPNNLTTIGDCAFWGSIGYSQGVSFTIPDSVAYIGDSAFYEGRINGITWNGTTYTNSNTFNQAVVDAGISKGSPWNYC